MMIMITIIMLIMMSMVIMHHAHLNQPPLSVLLRLLLPLPSLKKILKRGKKQIPRKKYIFNNNKKGKDKTYLPPLHSLIFTPSEINRSNLCCYHQFCWTYILNLFGHNCFQLGRSLS